MDKQSTLLWEEALAKTCQSGGRAGIHGKRSGLAFEYLRLLAILRPEWIVWENVPGVLSSNQGRDFKELLKAFNDAGYGCAWRVLDSKYFGVGQRRRRVFLVGHFGDWRPSAAVLFEREGLSGNPEKSRGTQEDFTKDNESSLRETEPELTNGFHCFGEGSFYTFREQNQASTLKASGGNLGGGSENFVFRDNGNLRKLTPKECLRLQGFPDDWFDGVEGYSDTAAYKAIGNSMAIPCMYWIGRRIQMVADILRTRGF